MLTTPDFVEITPTADIRKDRHGNRAKCLQRLIRLDRSGTVQVDQPLAVPDGHLVRQIAVGRDDSAYVVSTGGSVAVQRISPRGVQQWQADLPTIPARPGVTPDLVLTPGGAVVLALEPGVLRTARIGGSGLDVTATSTPMPSDLVSMGARAINGGNGLDVLMADEDPASPRMIHATADLRDLLSNGDPDAVDLPGRTVALDGNARAADTALSEPPTIRSAPSSAAAVRQPVIDTEGAAALPARADSAQAVQASAPQAASARTVDCRFVCMPDGIPAAKYPVTQTYRMTSGQSLNDITLDAFADHDLLCL
ncbi:MAG: hypothetical protein AAFR44_16130, partial [Pseudomonadota bacterium]